VRTGRCGIRKGSFKIRNKSCRVRTRNIEDRKSQSRKGRSGRCGIRKGSFKIRNKKLRKRKLGEKKSEEYRTGRFA
jgi:hypothetical protein